MKILVIVRSKITARHVASQHLSFSHIDISNIWALYRSPDASVSWEAVYRKGIPPAASWPHPTSRHIQSTDVIQPGPVQMSPVKILVPSIAATPKQLPSPKPLWLGWDMIDLCTRKSPKIQDDTSQYKCSASVPVPTGSHWIRKRAWNFQD